MTKEWLQKLHEVKEELKEDWALSKFVGDLDSQTLQRNAHALGQVQLIERLLEADYGE